MQPCTRKTLKNLTNPKPFVNSVYYIYYVMLFESQQETKLKHQFSITVQPPDFIIFTYTVSRNTTVHCTVEEVCLSWILIKGFLRPLILFYFLSSCRSAVLLLAPLLAEADSAPLASSRPPGFTGVEGLHSRFHWMADHVPAFRVPGGRICILHSPDEFYQAMKVCECVCVCAFTGWKQSNFTPQRTKISSTYDYKVVKTKSDIL